MPRVLLGLIVVLGIGVVVGPGAAQEAAGAAAWNFEQAENGLPAGWTAETWNGAPEFKYEAAGRNGGACVGVSSAVGADGAWIIKAPVTPWSAYKLSGWIRTENVEAAGGKGALLNVHGIDDARTSAITGTNDWTNVAVSFETDDSAEIQINCLLGGWGLAKGAAWFDDVALELVEQPAPGKPVRIDAAQTGAPMSKYIYGQFIEHLGRCIYGGIWAEMLLDRKFYDAVGAEGSPWTALGEPATVVMVTERPYVGAHMPRVTPGGGAAGIVHGGLGLIAGKAYAGRIVLAGAEGAGPVDVSLVWGDDPAARQTVRIEILTADFAKHPLAFTAGASTDAGRLEIAVSGATPVDIGAVSLMPADNVKGMRADTLALLKELDAPIYRWPGGNFVSGYNWKDGIGDRDRRPPRKNPAWQGIEHNDFGMHEFMAFCREVNTEAYVVVNSGLGDTTLAVEEVQYANGAADTPMGKLRAENGAPEPFAVTWWGVGNEMYGDWQLGHMPLEEYVKKHNTFAEAMRAEDPAIKLIGVGATGKWSETMLAQCAQNMDLLSEHFYCGENPRLTTHVREIAAAIRAKVRAHRRYLETIPALAQKPVYICMDEWNYWYGDHIYGELGTRYYLKDAIGIAAGLHEYSRSSDVIQMANYAQTVNVIGCIKTTTTAAALDTTGLVLKLYRHHFGTLPIRIDGRWAPLDIAAAWTEDKRALTIGVTNPTQVEKAVPLDLANVALTGEGMRWVLTGPDPMAHNAPGTEPLVTVREEPVSGFTNTLTVPPMSVCLYALQVQ